MVMKILTALWAVNSVFLGLATVAIIGRFYARKLRKLSPGVDDWAIFTALVRSLVLRFRLKLTIQGSELDIIWPVCWM